MGCVAYGCTNSISKKIPGITFHKFPKDETRRKLWLIAVRRKNFCPSKSSTLCSLHFSEDMIDRTSVTCVRLRENAVPTMFDKIPQPQKPNHRTKRNISTPVPNIEVKTEVPEMPLFPIITSTSSLNEDKFNEINGVCNESSKLISIKTDNESTPDCEEEIDKDSEENLKNKLEMMTKLYDRTCKKLRLCQEQCKLYVKQVIALEKVIDNLKQINSVTDFT